MRLAGDILKDRLPIRHHGRQHRIHCCTNRYRVKKDVAAGQMIGMNADHSIFYRIGCPQRSECFQMLIDRPRAQVAPAGHRHLPGSEPAEQRAQKVIACPHLPRKFIGNLVQSMWVVSIS